MLDPLEHFLCARATQLGLSMKDIASNACVARSHLYKIVGRETQPSLDCLVRLAHALEVAPVALLRFFADLSCTRPELVHSRAQGNNGDAVAFSADVTHADHAVMRPGEGFRKVWEIHNVGRAVWRRRRLCRVDRQYVIAPAVRTGPTEAQPLVSGLLSLDTDVCIPETPPGCSARIAVDFVAPVESCSIASVWRIYGEDGLPSFAPSFFLQAIVTVIAD